MSHTYTVAFTSTILVTVYDADSEGDAVTQAGDMLAALDDRDTQHEMNHGQVYFAGPDGAAPYVDHDDQCLSVEHEDD